MLERAECKFLIEEESLGKAARSKMRRAGRLSIVPRRVRRLPPWSVDRFNRDFQ